MEAYGACSQGPHRIAVPHDDDEDNSRKPTLFPFISFHLFLVKIDLKVVTHWIHIVKTVIKKNGFEH